MKLGRVFVLVLAAVGIAALGRTWLRPEPRGVERRMSRVTAPAAASARVLDAAESRGPEPEASRAQTEAAFHPEARADPAHSGRAEGASSSAGCVLYGRVRARDGAVFARWKPFVSATDVAGTRRQTDASEEGHYALSGLAPGKWTLAFGASGWRGATEELELSGSAPLRRDFVLERAPVLRIRVVTPEGDDFSEVRRARAKAKLRTPAPFFVATRESPGATIEEARNAGQDTIGVGSFWPYGELAEAAGPEFLGVLVLTVDPPVFVSLLAGTRVLATQLVAPGTDEATFVADPEALLEQQARVTLRAVAADTGEPLRGSVALDSSSIHSVRDGNWSEFLLPGDHSLSFWASGYARLPLEITLAPGEELDLGELRLPPELTIEGRLLDGEGNPVAGMLELGRRDESGKLRFADDLFRANPRGHYKVFGLVPGRYVLHTVGDDQVVFPGRNDPPTVWVSGNVDVSTLGGSVTDFDIRLVKAGTLVLRNAETLAPDSRCKVLDERGDLLRSRGFYPGFVPRFALPPGPCTLVLCDEDWNELTRHALTIAPGVNELDLVR